jgi:hypothetical protein
MICRVITDGAMGDVRVEIVVLNPRTGARSDPLVALADTGPP